MSEAQWIISKLIASSYRMQGSIDELQRLVSQQMMQQSASVDRLSATVERGPESYPTEGIASQQARAGYVD